MGNVISELALLLDNNNVTVVALDSFLYHADQFLGLAGSLKSHNDFNHFDHAPYVCYLVLRIE